MALIHIHHTSAPLVQQVGCCVCMPDDHRDGERLATVYLLHGLSDDHTTWQRRTSIERYAQRHRLIVVMPEGGRSYYTDAAHGNAAWEQHLLWTVQWIDRTFPTIAERRGRGVAGLSMGGYGALKLALKHPRLFAAATAHSAACDVARLHADPPRAGFMRGIFGERVAAQDDLFRLAESLLASDAPRPAIRMDCGAEDFLIELNRGFHAHLERIGLTHDYAEFPGAHTWEYWDLHVQEALAFQRAAFDAAR